jgi:hypothetical protein
VLEAGPTERERILAEAEDHLVEAVERLRAEGIAGDEAARIAVARFGWPGEVASRFAMERSSGEGRLGRGRWIALSIAASLLVLIAAGVVLIGQRGSQREPVAERGERRKFKSFTAVKVLTAYSESGEIRSLRTKVEASRSDGSKSSLSPSQNGGAAEQPRFPELRSVEDRTKRISAMILPEQLLVSSRPIPETAIRGPRSFSESQRCSFLLEALDSDPRSERAVMLGYEVRKQTFGSEGRHEIWVAPALDCYEMRSTTWWDAAGTRPRRIALATETVFVAEGEPPGEHFDIPAGFRECPPSEIFQTAWAGMNNRTAEYDSQFYRHADEQYYRIRNRRNDGAKGVGR